MNLKEEILTTQSNVPVGTVVCTTLEEKNLPQNWLLCNGQDVPAQYQILRGLMSKTPNLQGRTIVGVGSLDNNKYTINETGGESTHILSIAEMPKHNHTMPYSITWSGSGDSSYCKIMDVNHQTPPSDPAFANTAGESAAHNNMQPYYVLNYIIFAGNA